MNSMSDIIFDEKYIIFHNITECFIVCRIDFDRLAIYNGMERITYLSDVMYVISCMFFIGTDLLSWITWWLSWIKIRFNSKKMFCFFCDVYMQVMNDLSKSEIWTFHARVADCLIAFLLAYLVRHDAIPDFEFIVYAHNKCLYRSLKVHLSYFVVLISIVVVISSNFVCHRLCTKCENAIWFMQIPDFGVPYFNFNKF